MQRNHEYRQQHHVRLPRGARTSAEDGWPGSPLPFLSFTEEKSSQDLDENLEFWSRISEKLGETTAFSRLFSHEPDEFFRK